jgi:hypothetical protein
LLIVLHKAPHKTRFGQAEYAIRNINLAPQNDQASQKPSIHGLFVPLKSRKCGSWVRTREDEASIFRWSSSLPNVISKGFLSGNYGVVGVGEVIMVVGVVVSTLGTAPVPRIMFLNPYAFVTVVIGP